MPVTNYLDTNMNTVGLLSSNLFLENQARIRPADGDFAEYKKWVISTFGEGSKTKTVTRSKYNRIHKVLTGRSLGENAKFKFWVKTKGFCFLPCNKLNGRQSEMSGYVICVPNKKTSLEKVYKRVAVVEEFFDIIYDIHVNIEGRNGTHAGQKRTFRTIIESYAYLPREAVTHFLMSCKDCKGRMQLKADISWSSDAPASPLLKLGSPRSPHTQAIFPGYCSSPHSHNGSILSDQYSTMSADSDTPSTPAQNGAEVTTPVKEDNKRPAEADMPSPSAPKDLVKGEPAVKKLKPSTPIPATMTETVTAPTAASLNLSPTTSKKSSDEAEDEDDDDDDEKLSSSGTEIDPERLKAFNMFCRLFVDENLDRMVPISKQPKDKVQAILDACDRQFPEFHERSRKRIRTYLKSCRRMRRAREMNGWDSQFRPTPPHLTSPIAEGMLSQACENESNNAKRMRMGMEPISVSPPTRPAISTHTSHLAKSAMPSVSSAASLVASLQPTTSAAQAVTQPAHRMFPDWRFQHAQPFRPDMAPFFSNGFFRAPFPAAAFHSPIPAAATLQASQAASQLALHANEMAVKPQKPSAATSAASTSGKSSSLTATEIATIRQLISGYRESATFLYRSADELEQLISQSS